MRWSADRVGQRFEKGQCESSLGDLSLTNASWIVISEHDAKAIGQAANLFVSVSFQET